MRLIVCYDLAMCIEVCSWEEVILCVFICIFFSFPFLHAHFEVVLDFKDCLGLLFQTLDTREDNSFAHRHSTSSHACRENRLQSGNRYP